MAPMSHLQTPNPAAFDVLQNRIAVALAKRQRLIKSWTASSSRPRPPPKTEEELEKEDADLFRFEPPHLGLGAPIPKEFLDGGDKRKEISSNTKLRHLMLGNKSAGLQPSKPRDALQKTNGMKRGIKEQSSDEDEGRSSLGKAKKLNNGHMPRTHDKPAKTDQKAEVEKEVKPGARQVGLLGLSHMTRPVVKLHDKQVGSESQQQKTSVQASNNQRDSRKWPLVDYPSTDDDDGSASKGVPPPVTTLEERNDISRASLPKSSSTLNLGIDKGHNAGLLNGSVASAGSNSYGTWDVTLSRVSDNCRDNFDRSMHSNTKFKSLPRRYSKASSSLTDSEPPDMETVIPLALHSQVVATVSPTVKAETKLLTADDVKRAKKREKNARRRERKQHQKIMHPPLGILAGGKKLKDRLLDANGN